MKPIGPGLGQLFTERNKLISVNEIKSFQKFVTLTNRDHQVVFKVLSSIKSLIAKQSRLSMTREDSFFRAFDDQG